VREVVFLEVLTHVCELMTDPFGNYLCQRLLDVCTDTQRVCLLQRVAQDLVPISLNIHGTRVVQKIIEVMNTHSEVRA